MQAHRLWWSHLRAPLVIFLMLAGVFATTWADLAIARTFFFDNSHMRWIGTGNWWINEFLHTGGRWAIRGLVAVALVIWTATYVNRDWRGLRRPCSYFILSVVLGVAAVGALKTITNVDCPWDLQPFGGAFPVVELFADRPDALRAGRCFPAAHASSGFALVALYFVLRERSRRWAWLGLGAGLSVGLIFGIAQQSRGAHFLSHDLWSAFVVWLIALSMYAFVYKARLWGPVQDDETTAGEKLDATGEWPARRSVAVPSGAGGLSRASG